MKNFLIITCGLILATMTASAANVALTALPTVSSLSGAETIPLVQAGVTKTATVTQLAAATAAAGSLATIAQVTGGTNASNARADAETVATNTMVQAAILAQAVATNTMVQAAIAAAAAQAGVQNGGPATFTTMTAANVLTPSSAALGTVTMTASAQQTINFATASFQTMTVAPNSTGYILTLNEANAADGQQISLFITATTGVTIRGGSAAPGFTPHGTGPSTQLALTTGQTALAQWLVTPPDIIRTFGPFDLDPCAPVKRPWATADNHFTIEDDGLTKKWQGLVWCNPPYGPKTGDWLARCAAHGNCLVLVFARTDTRWFQNHVWPHAASLFFIAGRLSFCHVNGDPGGTAGAPSVLIAYGDLADQRLRDNQIIAGQYLQNLPNNIFLGSA